MVINKKISEINYTKLGLLLEIKLQLQLVQKWWLDARNLLNTHQIILFHFPQWKMNKIKQLMKSEVILQTW